MEDVYIALGSNQGDSAKICSLAVEALDGHNQIQVLKTSSLYRTQPVGMTDQDDFINGVILCRTDLSPEDLLEITRGIENSFHRARHQRWGPRTLDLDILTYGSQCLDLPWLTIPHPRLHERRFVLIPLAEVSPEWVHPVLGDSAADLLERLPETGQEVVRLSP
jgi:2-amino-4-hydroxy-6-hydroxymethyldihydropteridine diphosphokinase